MQQDDELMEVFLASGTTEVPDGHTDFFFIRTSKTKVYSLKPDASAYGLLLHCFPQCCPAFVSIKVFTLAGLARPLPEEACKTFMNILHETDTWKYAGAYMHHFNHYVYDDLFTSAAFTMRGSGQVVTMETGSRVLSFSGKSPYVMLTLFGSDELFRSRHSLTTALPNWN